VVFESVTDRRLAEQAQVEGQARKSAILDSALDAIVTIDHEGMIFEWNPAAEKTFGHRRHEVLARELAAVVLPEATRERFREGLARFVATGQSELFGRLVELTARRADGTEFPIEMSVTRVAKAGPPLLTGFLRDITERRKMEDQLRQAQKMEVVGQLAGGVAHDFNNILTVIQGHAALLGSRPNAAPSDRASLQQIVTAAERAASLTRKLLAFSRKQALQPRHLNLNEIVRHTTDMLQRLLGDHIALHVECRRELPAIHADQAMIEQVLMNLAVNARDAMPRGGQLTITTGLSEVDPHQVPPHPDAVPGRYVTFTVRDTGTGIAPDHLPRLFEPFFTTKGVGKGTGLGLATIYGIVKQHQGWITVESEVDHGTLFEIHLPASDGRPETETEVVPAPPGRGGPETILVVEDEPSLRSLVVNVLDNAGYRVLQAESGPAALRVWEAQHGEVDLLLTDMVMPEGLSGRELGLRLQGAKPALRVIYSSGYSPELLGEEFVQRQGAHFLQKPYRPHVLVAMVRQCLDARPQPPPPDRA
jgi:PAS domain S-box-containing protein